MIDVSGFGTEVTIIAAKAFPVGFTLSRFADDIDPVTAEDVDPTGFEMLYDGSVFAFDKAAPIKVTFGVIAGSPDDINLKILLQARKSQSSVIPFEDFVSAIITYPDGGRVVLSAGAILSGPLVDTIQSNGRKKGNAFTFVFGAITGAQSRKQFVASIAQAFL